MSRGRGRGPRAPARRRGLGGEQVEGRQAVRELLLAGRRRTHEVILLEREGEDDLADLARELRVPVRSVGRNRLEAMARTEAPQGVIARAAEVPEADLDELATRGAGPPPFLVALDGITDPGNVGAILRSAECAGATGALLPRHRSALLTPAAVKAAAGACEHLPIAVVPGIPAAIAQLTDREVWIVGLDPAGRTTVHDLEVATAALCLVVGSEGRGLSRLVRRRCDELVQIPIEGTIGSLNAAAAAAVGCFAVARERHRRAGSAAPTREDEPEAGSTSGR